MTRKSDVWIAPLGEGALILTVAAIGWALKQPLVFTSLGPTAYELVEKPKSKSAKPYNIVLGHCLAVGAAHFALWVMNAYAAPKVESAGFVPSARLWAAVIAVTLTTLTTLLLKASQPASLSTTLLVSLGSMQTAWDAAMICVAVVLITLIGEPVRIWREKTMDQ